MAKKSFSFEDLGAFNIETGEIDENKKQQIKKEGIEKQKREEQNSWKKADSGQRKNGGGDRNGGKPTKYVGAPYNFVPMWEKTVAIKKEEQISHDSADIGLISGEIDYKITARTPIIVDDGSGHFVKNHYGQYAIPGSSICGLIRSNVQVLSQSSLADDIDDYSLMYREVGGAKDTSMNKEKYDIILGSDSIMVNGKSVSILKNVKAGYIENTGSGYVIYHTKPDSINTKLGDVNYYVLSERYVFEQLSSGRDEFEYLKMIPLQHEYKNHEFKKYIDEKGHTHYVCIGKDRDSQDNYKSLLDALDEYADVKALRGRNKEEARNKVKQAKKLVSDNLNPRFKPGIHKVSYMVSNDRISAIGEVNKYKNNGCLVISGAMQEKKALYVIPEIDKDTKPIDLGKEDDKDVRAYKIDYENKKNQLGDSKEYWALPKNIGDIKPVFYVLLERIYFGFTPRLRLFYQNKIHDGLGDGHAKGVFDYAKSLFGYSSDRDSYKARVSFSDAKIVGDVMGSIRADKLILGEPKPTSYADYLNLKSNGASNTYNDDGFRLRGMKQYWLHDKADPKTPVEQKNVASTIHPLPEGTSFEGKVRFHNLRKEELGLLIWALKLSPESEMNIGKAKPYGYGRIKLNVSGVREFSPERAYDTTSFSLNPFEEINNEQINELVKAYKKEIAGKLGVQDVMELPSIKAFFKMKDSGNIPKEDKIRYMDIKKSEYQNRAPLKGVDETLS